jgi:hypothetical protein
MKILLAITIGFLILFCTNCNQCETTQCSDGNTKYRISKVVLDFFYFKTGSWWVYQNEISLERDSIYVVKDEYKKFFISEACRCDEKIWVVYNSNITDSLFYSTESFSDPSVIFNRIRYNSSFRDLTYRFKVENDTSLSLTNPHNAIITYLPKYKGLKEDFKNVYRCFYNKALTDYLSDSYFAPNVGLIRYQFKDGDGTYWNLINYHVIQ